MPSTTECENRIQDFHDPFLGTTWKEAGVRFSVSSVAGGYYVQVCLGYPVKQVKLMLSSLLQQHVQDRYPGLTVVLDVEQRIIAHAVSPGREVNPSIKNVVAVASGKGGVGKSTVAVNMALALLQEGARVGLLDADIYGPSQAIMLGHAGVRAGLNESGKLKPLEAYGMPSMSMAYLVGAEAPMVWRGPMVSQALQQMWRDTDWGELDYLIVDLPPGTGDIQLTLAQKIPVSAAVLVTTPQSVALADVVRAFEMFQKVNIPVLGVIENMSTWSCSQCGHEEAIFGDVGVLGWAASHAVPVLGRIPLSARICADVDVGSPTVVHSPDGFLASQYHGVARALAGRLALRPKDYARQFPKIVVT